MSDCDARMPDLPPPGVRRLYGDQLDEGFQLEKIPNALVVKVVMKMQSNQKYKMQMMNKRFFDVLKNYPNLCKPAVIVNISTADHYHPKLYSEPDSHCLSATMKRTPATIQIRSPDWHPGECLLQDQGIISHRIIYEKPNTKELMETFSCRAYFETTLGTVRIAELTINFDDVEVSPSMMSLMEKYLARDKQCYDNLTLHLISRNTRLGCFANLLHAIRPARLKFEGNHCLDIKEIRLPDLRLFIRDNEMGSSEVMARVAQLVEEWLYKGRELDFLYIQFGAGGAVLPRLTAYNAFPLKKVIKYDYVIHYYVPKLNRRMHIRILRNQVWLAALEEGKDY